MGVRSDSSQALCPAVDHGGGAAAAAWPPGFRFHPTDEELILYYLKRKICRRGIKLDVIRETDVYKWDPEELPGQSLLKTGDRQWFFFSPRERRYPNGARSNRATRHGYWKVTGKDRNITCNSRSVGVKKTLVFYQGRAPNGERTDWVMHEYTLDEDELNRCQNVQDYYALYKVFKKSGPGPKNGEQYGAPFKEEEWDEDDHVEVTFLKNSMIDSTIKPSFDELEELMNQLDTEPLFGEQTNVSHSSAKQCNEPARFDITQSASSQLQMYEASEVISAHDNFKHKVDISEEGFLEMNDLFGPEPTISNPVENMTFDDFKHRVDTSEEGFLEMDDLVGHEHTISSSVENMPFEEIDGLGEVVDLFLDSDMFLHDMGPIDQGVSHLGVNTLDSDLLNYQLEPYMANELHYQAQPDDMVNQLNYLLQADDTVNQVNYPFLPDSDVSDQLWMHDQRDEVVTLSEPNQGTSGALLESAHVHNPGPSGQQPVATTSRFSSALWSFVESIPTTPASAAESALVNRAFERMSSFSRLRINANVNSNRPVTKRSARNRGFIFFSVLGAICAILWMFMGTVRLWGRCILS